MESVSPPWVSTRVSPSSSSCAVTRDSRRFSNRSWKSAPARDGTRQHRSRRSPVDDFSPIENHHLVGECEDVRHVMAHHERRDPVKLPHPGQIRKDPVLQADVEGGHGLVEEQKPRLGKKGSPERDPLALPSRKAGGAPVQ